MSLDGFTEVSHDWMRGKKGSWENAVDAIEQIAATPDLVFDVVTCVNKPNIGDLKDLKEMLYYPSVLKITRIQKGTVSFFNSFLSNIKHLKFMLIVFWHPVILHRKIYNYS